MELLVNNLSTSAPVIVGGEGRGGDGGSTYVAAVVMREPCDRARERRELAHGVKDVLPDDIFHLLRIRQSVRPTLRKNLP